VQVLQYWKLEEEKVWRAEASIAGYFLIQFCDIIFLLEFFPPKNRKFI
jgi:hypothetical protein